MPSFACRGRACFFGRCPVVDCGQLASDLLTEFAADKLFISQPVIGEVCEGTAMGSCFSTNQGGRLCPRRDIMIYPILRRQSRPGTVCVEPKPARKVIFQVANQIELVEASLHLVYTAYRRRGLIGSNISGLRVTSFHLHPKTEVLAARDGGRLFCTTTLICDNPELGLPIDSMYPEEVNQKRSRGLRLAEASCLADDPYRKTPLSILLRLMAFTIQCAQHRGVSELLAVVHPHHADFYTKFLGFEVFAEVRPCPAVRNHPAAALALDLQGLARKNPRAYRRAFEPRFPESSLRRCPLSEEIRDYLTYRWDGPISFNPRSDRDGSLRFCG